MLYALLSKSDKEHCEIAKIPKLFIFLCIAHAVEVAVILAEFIMQGNRAISKDVADNPLGCHVHLKEEESPSVGLSVFQNKGGVRDNPVFGTLRRINVVGGFPDNLCPPFDPAVFEKGFD